jgi:hypothetical protein
MQEEILGIDAAVEKQRASVGLGFWQPFKALATNRRVLYRFILGGLLFLFQNVSGINAINCEYTEIILRPYSSQSASSEHQLLSSRQVFSAS